MRNLQYLHEEWENLEISNNFLILKSNLTYNIAIIWITSRLFKISKLCNHLSQTFITQVHHFLLRVTCGAWVTWMYIVSELIGPFSRSSWCVLRGRATNISHGFRISGNGKCCNSWKFRLAVKAVRQKSVLKILLILATKYPHLISFIRIEDSQEL